MHDKTKRTLCLQQLQQFEIIWRNLTPCFLKHRQHVSYSQAALPIAHLVWDLATSQLQKEYQLTASLGSSCMVWICALVLGFAVGWSWLNSSNIHRFGAAKWSDSLPYSRSLWPCTDNSFQLCSCSDDTHLKTSFWSQLHACSVSWLHPMLQRNELFCSKFLLFFIFEGYRLNHGTVTLHGHTTGCRRVRPLLVNPDENTHRALIVNNDGGVILSESLGQLEILISPLSSGPAVVFLTRSGCRETDLLLCLLTTIHPHKESTPSHATQRHAVTCQVFIVLLSVTWQRYGAHTETYKSDCLHDRNVVSRFIY